MYIYQTESANIYIENYTKYLLHFQSDEEKRRWEDFLNEYKRKNIYIFSGKQWKIVESPSLEYNLWKY